jgi:C4-dicarboxylate-specific signal transduction histidine kinase
MLEQAAMRDASVVNSKKPETFDEEYLNPNTNEKYYFETTRIPLMDKENSVYGICGISYDLTLERESKKQLEEERTKIATASKLAALGMLAAELGHEINNPLAIIRTSSWIMRKVVSAENFAKDLALTKLDEIDTTIQRISDIVTSVKNLSRDSSKEKMQDYVLKDILRDVQSICGSKFQPRGITFKLDDKNSLLNDKIYCYRVQLSEVLINLLANAIDAVENVARPWIKMDILSDSQNLVIRIYDNGPGIPEEIEKKIFAPFFSTKDLGKGTGLGLSISKEIMKRHGGDLMLNRKIGPSCFEAILPINKKELSAE